MKCLPKQPTQFAASGNPMDPAGFVLHCVVWIGWAGPLASRAVCALRS